MRQEVEQTRFALHKYGVTSLYGGPFVSNFICYVGFLLFWMALLRLILVLMFRTLLFCSVNGLRFGDVRAMIGTLGLTGYPAVIVINFVSI